jgi:hypothetical protein
MRNVRLRGSNVGLKELIGRVIPDGLESARDRIADSIIAILVLGYPVPIVPEQRSFCRENLIFSAGLAVEVVTSEHLQFHL